MAAAYTLLLARPAASASSIGSSFLFTAPEAYTLERFIAGLRVSLWTMRPARLVSMPRALTWWLMLTFFIIK